MDTLDERLRNFWQQSMELITTSPVAPANEQAFPIARVKRVMKMTDDSHKIMVSHDAPLLLIKAAEIFVMELTIRAWANAEKSRRRTLQKADIIAAASNSDMYDFLVDIIPRDDQVASLATQGQVLAPLHASLHSTYTSDQQSPQRIQHYEANHGIPSSPHDIVPQPYDSTTNIYTYQGSNHQHDANIQHGQRQ